MPEVASAFISLLPSTKGFASKLDSQIGGEVDASGKRSGARFGTAFKATAAIGVTAGVPGAGLYRVGPSEDACPLAALPEVSA